MSRKNRYADREPSVADLLSDPIAEALMRADGITVADVLAWIARRTGGAAPAAVEPPARRPASSDRAPIRNYGTGISAAGGYMAA